MGKVQREEKRMADVAPFSISHLNSAETRDPMYPA